MSSLKEQLTETVGKTLALHAEPMCRKIELLIAHGYPADVRRLHFEIFPDGGANGYCIRAFFYDANWSEFFVYSDGKAEYPSPIDPGLLSFHDAEIQRLEDELFEDDETFDSYVFVAELILAWLAKLWRKAAHPGFALSAAAQVHDETRTYDLIAQRWSG